MRFEIRSGRRKRTLLVGRWSFTARVYPRSHYAMWRAHRGGQCTPGPWWELITPRSSITIGHDRTLFGWPVPAEPAERDRVRRRRNRMTTHTRTHVFVSFANPHLTCDHCRYPVTSWHNSDKCGCDGEAWLQPCGHVADTSNTCPTWGPVDGCTCPGQHESNDGGNEGWATR